jgi:hypothetical protein
MCQPPEEIAGARQALSPGAGALRYYLLRNSKRCNYRFHNPIRDIHYIAFVNKPPNKSIESHSHEST